MDPNIQAYLERTLNVLLYAGAESVDLLDIRETRGGSAKLDAIIRFPYDSLLDVSLTLDVSTEPPQWLAYSFHYMTGDSVCIFRYDNAGHYRGLQHFPHHKHEGHDERVSDCPQPSARTIRDDIEAHLRQFE